MSDVLFSFLILLATSFVFSTLLSRLPLLRIPSTVGYLLFGMALQRGAKYISVAEVHWLNHLADFGLLFLMYVSGMEVNVGQLIPYKRQGNQSPVLLQGVSIFSTTLLMSFAISLVLSRYAPTPTNPYMLALLFSTTSLGVILPILEELGLLQKSFGQTLLVSALVADFFTMLLLSIFISIHTSGSLVHLLSTMAIIPFTGLVYITLRLIQRLPRLRHLAGDAHNRIRALIALLSITTALADFTGAEPILGSFLVGMLVSAIPFSFKETVRNYSNGIGYGFFIPLFFLSVGLDFDFHSVFTRHAWIWICILLAVFFAVKIVPVIQLSSMFGRRKAISGGILLSARLSLIAAAAQVGVQIGTMSQSFADLMVLTAMISSIVAPTVFAWCIPRRA